MFSHQVNQCHENLHDMRLLRVLLSQVLDIVCNPAPSWEPGVYIYFQTISLIPSEFYADRTPDTDGSTPNRPGCESRRSLCISNPWHYDYPTSPETILLEFAGLKSI